MPALDEVGPEGAAFLGGCRGAAEPQSGEQGGADGERGGVQYERPPGTRGQDEQPGERRTARQRAAAHHGERGVGGLPVLLADDADDQ